MANINKIRLSGQTYNIEDVNASKTVELTQAQYDALVTAGTIDVNTFYIITDAEYFDPSDVMTSAQTESAITAAVSGKADTSAVTSVNNALTAHTGDSTIHVTTAQTAAWNAKSDFSGSYNDLTNKPSIPSKTSDLTNDSNFTTSGYVDSQVSGKTDITSFTAHTANTDIHVTTAQTAAWNAKSDFSGSYNDLTDKPTIPTSASQLTNDVGYLVTNDITGKTDTSAFTAHTSDSDIHVTSSEKSTWNAKSDFSGSYNDLTDKPTLFSGDYNDLSNKPTIPSKTSDLTNDSNFATSGYVDSAVSGKANSSDVYTKSQTSAATEISTALNAKADTATTYTKTEVDNAITSATSTKQDTLVSGTNIKTINNESILGSGNINIQGGGIDSGTVQTMIDESISGKADSSDVYTKSETSGATEIATALSGKQDTLSAGTNITIVDNVISAEGGGKAVSGGTNISITTGETADTINCTLPITATSNAFNTISVGQGSGGGSYNTLIGPNARCDNNNGHNVFLVAQKSGNSASGAYVNGTHNVIIGCMKDGYISFNIPSFTTSKSVVIGGGGISTDKDNSVAIGYQANVSGTTKTNINNQLTIDTSNQVYISNSANTSTYCLQEKIENTESALGGLSLVKLSQSEYDALATKDSNTLYVING